MTFEDRSKAAHNGLEWREDIRGFLNHISDHLGRGVHSGPQTRPGLVLVCAAAPIEDTIPGFRAFGLFGTRNRPGGVKNCAVCVAQKNGQMNLPEQKPSTYRWTPASVWSKERVSPRWKTWSQDLSPIPSGAAPPIHSDLDLGWRLPHSWLYFAPLDPSVVERGAAYRR